MLSACASCIQPVVAVYNVPGTVLGARVIIENQAEMSLFLRNVRSRKGPGRQAGCRGRTWRVGVKGSEKRWGRSGRDA